MYYYVLVLLGKRGKLLLLGQRGKSSGRTQMSGQSHFYHARFYHAYFKHTYIESMQVLKRARYFSPLHFLPFVQGCAQTYRNLPQPKANRR